MDDLDPWRSRNEASDERIPAHFGLGARHHAEAAEQVSQGHLDLQLGQPHPHTVPGSRPEREVDKRVPAGLRFRSEPGREKGKSAKQNKNKTFWKIWNLNVGIMGCHWLDDDVLSLDKEGKQTK